MSNENTTAAAITPEVFEEQVVVAKAAPVKPPPPCSSVSPTGILTCELLAGHVDAHQVTLRTINGPQVMYWF